MAQELAKLQFPHIYPDPEARRLRAALAEDCGIPAEHIMAGARVDVKPAVFFRSHILYAHGDA